MNIQGSLSSALRALSDKDHEQLLTFFRFWIGVGQTYSQIPSDLIFNAIYTERGTGHSHCNFIYPTARQILRFVSDVESDPILAPHSAGLESRFCARILQEFFDTNLGVMCSASSSEYFYMDVNLIAHYTNLGYMEEDTIRTQILQSLISHPRLYTHQAEALAILFKIAGATFEAYAGPTVVDRCFELLMKHYRDLRDRRKQDQIQVRMFSVQKGWN